MLIDNDDSIDTITLGGTGVVPGEIAKKGHVVLAGDHTSATAIASRLEALDWPHHRTLWPVGPALYQGPEPAILLGVATDGASPS